MTLDQRDASIVHHVARFGQLSSSHIHQLIFHSLASRTPCERALRRLVRDEYLIRVERRMVGGAKGGSGQYVYALGRRGFFTYFEGRWRPARNVNYHALALVDCWLVIKQLERAGQVQVLGASTEPDCWVTVGRQELRPDMYVELARSSGETLKLWLEMDMATEGQRQLRGQLQDYQRAYEQADLSEWTVWPRVVWIGVDDERAKELRWLIDQEPAEGRAMFQVCTRESLGQLLQS